MPVTARLSRRFYEVLGEDVANELVDWLNAVDLTYRTDLRELNQVNFARFDARLEQRLAELRAELRQELEVLRSEVRLEIAGRRPEFRTELQRVRAELVFTMFVFWFLNLVSTAGLVIVLGWH